MDAIQQTDEAMPSETLTLTRTSEGSREPDEEAQVRAAIAGEPRAMEAVMRRYNRRLFRLARSILHSDAEAEDVVQETYLKVFLKRAAWRGDGPFGAWIARIAVNLALTRRRTLSRRPEQLPQDPPLDDAAGSVEPWGDPTLPTPERAAALAELRRIAEREIDNLSEGYRQVFMLRIIEGLSIEETAELLSIAPGAVKTRLHRAHQQLREALEGHLSAATLQAFPFAGARCDRMVARVLERVARSA